MLQLRLATTEDADTLQDILKAASLANPGDRDWLLAHPEVLVVDADQLHAGRIHVAAATNGELLGYAAVLPPQAGQAEIDGIFVRPTHWRQGVGRTLLRACAAQARAEGARELGVVVNPHALAFYAALGFEMAAEEDQPQVAAGQAYAMRCRLDGG
jgi:N-acetylglutamate synthase-like GNAT family acetyltransferase